MKDGVHVHVASLNVLLVEDSGIAVALPCMPCVNRSASGRCWLRAAGKRRCSWHAPPQTSCRVAICDLDMPQMDGVELIRLLAEERLVTHLIVLSALDYSLLQHRCRDGADARAGGAGAIAKPISSNKLVDLLSRYRPQSGERSGDAGRRAAVQSGRIAARHCRLRAVGVFQPQASVADRSVYGAEALVRWKHPLHGMGAAAGFPAHGRAARSARHAHGGHVRQGVCRMQ